MKFAAICGLAGCAIISGCVLLSMMDYSGIDCEPYSLANHFISELHDRRISVGSAYFNGGMMIGSLLLTLFGIGFSMRYNGWQRYLVGFLSLLTGISCAFVGFYPMDLLRPHLIAAMIFFHSALALVFFCSGAALLAKKPVLPRSSAMLGLVTALFFAAFVFWPKDIIRSWTHDPVHFVRPSIWWHPVLEWACFFSIILWMVLTALLVWKRKLD